MPQGQSIAEALGDPYDLMNLVQDVAGAYICTVANGKGCSAAEKAYAASMQEKSGMEKKKLLLGLKNQLRSDEAEDDADLKTSLWQRLSILKQLTVGRLKDYLPSKIYKEHYDPEDWKYPPMPKFIEKVFLRRG